MDIWKPGTVVRSTTMMLELAMVMEDRSEKKKKRKKKQKKKQSTLQEKKDQIRQGLYIPDSTVWLVLTA